MKLLLHASTQIQLSYLRICIFHFSFVPIDLPTVSVCTVFCTVIDVVHALFNETLMSLEILSFVGIRLMCPRSLVWSLEVASLRYGPEIDVLVTWQSWHDTQNRGYLMSWRRGRVSWLTCPCPCARIGRSYTTIRFAWQRINFLNFSLILWFNFSKICS